MNQTFSNEIDLDQYIEWNALTGIIFVNYNFQELDLLGKVFGWCDLKNCKFNNLSFRKCQFSNCRFQNCQITKRIQSFKFNEIIKLFCWVRFSNYASFIMPN